MIDRYSMEALIFDLDGTLVHSEPAWELAKRRVLARYRIAATQDFLDAYVGRGLRGFVEEAFGADLTKVHRDQIADEIEAEADILLPSMREPIPGAAAFLQAMRSAGLRIAICSSSPRRHIEGALIQLGCADLVPVVVSASELPRGKPDALPYLETLRRLDLPPLRACAVEDAVPGFVSAKAAGLAVIGIGATALQPEHASLLDMAVADFRELAVHF